MFVDANDSFDLSNRELCCSIGKGFFSIGLSHIISEN